MTELGKCDQCERVGRAHNLTTHYSGKHLCPECLKIYENRQYHIMHYWLEGTQKRIQVFDMERGRLYKVWEKDYLDGNLEDKMLQDMSLDYEEKVLNRAPYKG